MGWGGGDVKLSFAKSKHGGGGGGKISNLALTFWALCVKMSRSIVLD